MHVLETPPLKLAICKLARIYVLYIYMQEHCMPISNCTHPPCHIPSAGDLVCHCNQLLTPGCNAVNGSWGNCTLTRGEGVCLASYEVLLGTNEVNIQHTCSTDAFLKLRCLPGGFTKSGSAQYPIITACCEKDYCNTPQYLQQFLPVVHC